MLAPLPSSCHDSAAPRPRAPCAAPRSEGFMRAWAERLARNSRKGESHVQDARAVRRADRGRGPDREGRAVGAYGARGGGDGRGAAARRRRGARLDARADEAAGRGGRHAAAEVERERRDVRRAAACHRRRDSRLRDGRAGSRAAALPQPARGLVRGDLRLPATGKRGRRPSSDADRRPARGGRDPGAAGRQSRLRAGEAVGTARDAPRAGTAEHLHLERREHRPGGGDRGRARVPAAASLRAGTLQPALPDGGRAPLHPGDAGRGAARHRLGARDRSGPRRSADHAAGAPSKGRRRFEPRHAPRDPRRRRPARRGRERLPPGARARDGPLAPRGRARGRGVRHPRLRARVDGHAGPRAASGVLHGAQGRTALRAPHGDAARRRARVGETSARSDLRHRHLGLDARRVHPASEGGARARGARSRGPSPSTATGST